MCTTLFELALQGDEIEGLSMGQAVSGLEMEEVCLFSRVFSSRSQNGLEMSALGGRYRRARGSLGMTCRGESKIQVDLTILVL